VLLPKKPIYNPSYEVNLCITHYVHQKYILYMFIMALFIVVVCPHTLHIHDLHF
jgi:hypothetical protein